MPFRQLKSFFKILIGVQYHCIAIHPGMPEEYPQKRQSFRLHRCFRCGWPLVCGRQDASALWSTRHRAAGWQRSTGLLHLHGFESVAISGAGNRTRLHYGASGVEPPGGNSPPDCCIYMGSSPLPGYQKREPPRGLSFLVRVAIQNFLKKPVISTVFKADE